MKNNQIVILFGDIIGVIAFAFSMALDVKKYLKLEKLGQDRRIVEEILMQ